ncbi:MAG: hypothetical protein ACFFBH_16325 [Promethearchaeota archaeon]
MVEAVEEVPCYPSEDEDEFFNPLPDLYLIYEYNGNPNNNYIFFK